MEQPLKVYVTFRVTVLYLTLTTAVVYTADKTQIIAAREHCCRKGVPFHSNWHYEGESKELCATWWYVDYIGMITVSSPCTPKVDRRCRDYLNHLTYMSIEHATTLYHDKNLITEFNFVAFRYGRASPVYYVNMNFTAAVWFGNNFSMSFYFYEFLSNRYQPSFVEMHFKFCKLIHEDLFFGAAMKQGKLDGPCPYPPGDYGLQNMTILPDAIPSGFPFTKGRIYVNMTYIPKNLNILQIYVNMELRQIKIKNRKKMSKL